LLNKSRAFSAEERKILKLGIDSDMENYFEPTVVNGTPHRQAIITEQFVRDNLPPCRHRPLCSCFGVIVAIAQSFDIFQIGRPNLIDHNRTIEAVQIGHAEELHKFWPLPLKIGPIEETTAED
jgi:hypothetical protein